MELRDESSTIAGLAIASDVPWDTPGTFDAIYYVAKARGIEVEY
jgi:hypothetical protein